jgi:hypothetical protein
MVVGQIKKHNWACTRKGTASEVAEKRKNVIPKRSEEPAFHRCAEKKAGSSARRRRRAEE